MALAVNGRGGRQVPSESGRAPVRRADPGEVMLKRLEESIRELVRRYEAAVTENQRLREGLTLRELEIKGLRKKIEKLNSERDLVRERVDALISHVEGLVSGT